MIEKTFEEMGLEWDDFYWLGNSEFDRGIEIHICSKDEKELPPHGSQLKAWLQFTGNFELIYPKILDTVFDYYMAMHPQHLAMGQEFIKNMPELNNPSEIKNMIILNHICISWPDEEGKVRLGLNFTCDWEREHGLGVVLESGVVTEVGGADCAIL